MFQNDRNKRMTLPVDAQAFLESQGLILTDDLEELMTIVVEEIDSATHQLILSTSMLWAISEVLTDIHPQYFHESANGQMVYVASSQMALIKEQLKATKVH